MRVQFDLEDSLLNRVDALVGSARRSAFVSSAIERALDDAERWTLLESASGAISDSGHDWDADPAEWVRSTRRAGRHPMD